MSPGTKSHRIALLFEYATLNGGERSMLACLDWLRCHETNLEFVAIAPAQGRLAEALAARGITVIPWTTAGTGVVGSLLKNVRREGEAPAEPQDTTDVPHLSGSAGSSPSLFQQTVRMSREEVEQALIQAVAQANPALLHANSLAMGRLTGRIAGRLPIPTSAHLRDILNLSRAAIADLNRNQLLIAVSQATRDMHVAQGMDPGRVVVVRNGVDLVQFQPRPRSGWLHRELQLPASAILIATIGQIGLRKGQEILAAAAPEIVRYVPEAYFLLIGERSSTKAESVQFERDIERRFAEHNLTPHLHRLGYREDIPELMAEIDLIVHPAHQEPFGRVLLEAAASGVPVVATNVGGTSEIVVDGVTGRLVPPRDPQSLAGAVIGMLTRTDGLQSVSLAAQARALSEFDVATSAERLSNHWCSLIG